MVSRRRRRGDFLRTGAVATRCGRFPSPQPRRPLSDQSPSAPGGIARQRAVPPGVTGPECWWVTSLRRSPAGRDTMVRYRPSSAGGPVRSPWSVAVRHTCQGPLTCREMTVAFGMGPVPARVEARRVCRRLRCPEPAPYPPPCGQSPTPATPPRPRAAPPAYGRPSSVCGGPGDRSCPGGRGT
jgi:hypothetical protein